jgi:PTH2 family peptidyl-tRNA hydrolase
MALLTGPSLSPLPKVMLTAGNSSAFHPGSTIGLGWPLSCSIFFSMSENTHKQVILVRTDLKMNKGKIGAQVAHASMAALLTAATQDFEFEDTLTLNLSDPRFGPWLNGAFTKVCLKVDDEETLLEYYEVARIRGMLTSLIRDSGRTVFHGNPTHTCVAIGPDTCEKIDDLTGELKLL